MPSPNEVKEQIDGIVAKLVEIGLADDQRFALQRRRHGGLVEVTFEGGHNVSVAFKDRAYSAIYRDLVDRRAYNAKMPDGGLIQMMYSFARGTLESHRLAFFPSPDLEEFQNNPDIYLQDEVYADVVAKNIVPFPLRFDYARDDPAEGLHHPKTHLTLGQYQNCRIPVSGPMTPSRFADFVLRNFYHTALIRYADRLPSFVGSFAESIRPSERNVVHVVTPV